MDIKDKIVKALQHSIQSEYIRLEDDDGISGFLVSPQFEGVSTFDRQRLIDEALSKGPDALTPQEQRRVLMIAGLTPSEYETVGTRIRVHKVKQMAGGVVEVLLHGGQSDAEYVRGALNHRKGVETTTPKPPPGAVGILMSFKAKGSRANPLTRESAMRVLKSDPYIEVMPNA